jgi:hypothetical protein
MRTQSTARRVRRIRSASLELIAGGSEEDGFEFEPEAPAEPDFSDVPTTEPQEPTEAESETFTSYAQDELAEYEDLASPQPPTEEESAAFTSYARDELANYQDLASPDIPNEHDERVGASDDFGLDRPDYPDAPPIFTASDLADAGAGPTQEALLASQIDRWQAYQDLAMPPTLQQGELADCYLVSAVDAATNAPGGYQQMQMRILPVEGGFMEVGLRTRDDGPVVVSLQPPGPAEGSLGDERLRLIERAHAVMDLPGDINVSGNQLYLQSRLNDGGSSTAVMRSLGFEARGLYADEVASAVANRQPNQFFVFNTNIPDGENKEALLDMLEGYKASPWHGYPLAGTYRDPGTGENMYVLRNVWGFKHPLPVRESDLGLFLQGASRGTVPVR